MADTVYATVTTPGPPGPTGPTGYSPQFIVAAGTPGPATGNNGDMFINSSTGDVYGPKTGGAWGGIVCNIKGPAGTPGTPGYSPQYIVQAGVPSNAVGNNGDMYINSATSDVYGPKTGGSWGAVACNIRGTTGATGAQGPPGVGYTARGAWVSTTNYLQGDQVSYGSGLYISLQTPNTNNNPSTSPTFWQPVAGMTDPTTTKGDLIVHGTATTRMGTGGAPNNGMVLTVDDSQTLGVKWAPAAASQTPWLSNIDGAGFNLMNAGRIAVANSGAVLPDANTSNPALIVGQTTASSNSGEITVCSNATAGYMGGLNIANYNISVAEKRIAIIGGGTDGAANSGYLVFYTFNAGTIGEKMRILSSGAICINTTASAAPATFALTVDGGSTSAGLRTICATSNGSDTGLMIQNRAASGRNYSIYSSGGSSGLGAGNLTLYDDTASAARIILNPGGSVGFGTRNISGVVTIQAGIGGNYSQNSLIVQTADYVGGSTGTMVRFGLQATTGNVFGAIEALSGGGVLGGGLCLQPDGGNVVVGGTSPSPANERFTVITSISKTTASTSFGAYVVTNDASNPFGLQIRIVGASSIGGRYAMLQTGDVNLADGGNLTLNPGGGLVGVGLNNPQAKLHVFATGASYNGPFQNSGQLFVDSGLTTNYAGIAIGYDTTIGSNGQGFIQAGKSGVAYEPLVLNPNGGGVAIGKISPGYTLDLTGDCNISGSYRVNGTPISAGGALTSVAVNPGRSGSTVYNNGTGKPMFVSVTGYVAAGSQAELRMGTTNPPTNTISYTQNTNTGTSYMVGVCGWVLPGYYYQLYNTAMTVVTWCEWT